MKRIPVKAARKIADEYGQSQVILITWDRVTGKTHVVTYGRTVEDCKQAAAGGNAMKRFMGWPEELCNAQPARARRRAKKEG
jgi:hypothetical protein